jgi:hypothetical protein
MDLFMGILTIILVIIIINMKSSENQLIALIGWGIILAAKMFH